MRIVKGFTLAEVLITLGIIGVVLAMTLPTLITKIRIIQLHSQFNKMYADLNQAAKLFYANENTSVPNYGKITVTSERSDKLLQKYMSYFKGSSTTTEKLYEVFDRAHNISNGEGHNTCDESGVMLDMSGRIFVMDNTPSRTTFGPKICVDTNGVKGPNKLGYDRFTFVFTEDNTVEPYTGTDFFGLSENITDEEQIKNQCKGVKAGDTRNHCAYFALKDKNPTGYGTYWKNFLK